MNGTTVTAIVLAGGESLRFGTDKMLADVDGALMLDRVLDGLPPTWQVVCVGPPRPTDRAVVWVREDPPGGGPLSGVAAAVDALTSRPELSGDGHAQQVVVIAGDMPWSGPAAALLASTLGSHPEVSAAVAVDDDGHANPLLAAYDLAALAAHLPRPAHGRRAKLLLELPHVRRRVPGRAGWDVDTPEDLDRD